MIMIVCGSRDWTDAYRVDCCLAPHLQNPRIGNDLTIVQGGCRGADRMAATWAHKHGVPEIEVAAQWEYYGPRAGPIRNRWMLKVLKPDMVLALHDDIEKSKGTKDMVGAAVEAGVQVVRVVTSDGTVTKVRG